MQKIEESLRKNFTGRTISDLVDSLRKAYESNLIIYNPGIGHDETTFGFMIAKSRIHFICESAIKNPEIKIIKRNPYIYFQVGDYFVSSYRVGSSLDDGIADLFPKNRNRAWKLAKKNLIPYLPFSELEDFEIDQEEYVDNSNFRQVILADIGNSEEGFCGAFLGIPSKFDQENKTITDWAYQLMISEHSFDYQSKHLIIKSDILSPIINIMPPDLTLKITKIENEKK